MSTETETQAVPETANRSSLLLVLQQSGLEPTTEQRLKDVFIPLFDQAEEWAKKVDAINITSVSQVREMKLARETRLALRDIRIKGDNTRKALKDNALKLGRAIDGIFGLLRDFVAPLEARLQGQEDFAERQEALRKAELKVTREAILAPYPEVNTAFYSLGEMADADFDQLLANTKLAAEARLEAQRRLEAERIAKEAERLAEQEKIKAENERLREVARLANLARERTEKLLAVGASNPPQSLELLPEDTFAQILASAQAAFVAEQAKRTADEQARKDAEAKAQQEIADAKARHETALAEERRLADEARVAAQAKADAARLEAEAKAKAERDELARKAAIDAEYERQKATKEREALEAKLADERRASETARLQAEAKAAEERETLRRQAEIDRKARESAEAETRKAHEAEVRRLADEAEAKKKAEQAPDAEKLAALALALRSLEIPTLTSDAGKAIIVTVRDQFAKFSTWLDGKSNSLK